MLRAEAPITVNNFHGYIARGDYDGSVIHRSVPGFVIQGGSFQQTPNSVSTIPTQPPILNEPCTIEPGNSTCTTRSNVRGSVAMAKGGLPNSATSGFFINLADNSGLDSVNEGFTVFANVLGSGMTVADDVAALSRVDPDESWWLDPQSGSALGELPVVSSVPFFPTPFGCWDPTNIAVVVDPLNHTLGLPDPIFGTSFYPLSGDCGMQIPRFTFTEDSGPASCPDKDVLSTGITGLASLGIVIDPGTNDFLQFEFTCPDVAQAVNQRALWRDDYGSRLSPQLIVVTSATYQPVPEPAIATATLIGSLALAGSTRRLRRLRA